MSYRPSPERNSSRPIEIRGASDYRREGERDHETNEELDGYYSSPRVGHTCGRDGGDRDDVREGDGDRDGGHHQHTHGHHDHHDYQREERQRSTTPPRSHRHRSHSIHDHNHRVSQSNRRPLSPQNQYPNHPMSLPNNLTNFGPLPPQLSAMNHAQMGPGQSMHPQMNPGFFSQGMGCSPPPMGSMIPPGPQDYTTFSAMSGNNVRMNPFATPHTAYPNAMPLSTTMDVPPVAGYGTPRYPSFAKPGQSVWSPDDPKRALTIQQSDDHLIDYRRFCYAVGKAEVPYASLNAPPPPLGMGMPR